MAAPGEKSFFVSEYHASKSAVTVQRVFHAKYAKDPPTDKIIRSWYKQFTDTGCLCKQNAPMLTYVCVCVCVWQELEYRIAVCRVTAVHTANICGCQKKFSSFLVAVNNSIKVGRLVFLL